MIRLSINPDAVRGKKKKKSSVLQRISFCQPANSGAYHAQGVIKKELENSLVVVKSQIKHLLETTSMHALPV